MTSPTPEEFDAAYPIEEAVDLKPDEYESIAEQYTEIILDGMDWKTMYQYCYDSMMDFHTRDCSGIELKELIDNYDEELFEELLDNARHEIAKDAASYT